MRFVVFLLLVACAGSLGGSAARAQGAMTPARRASAAKLHFDRGQTYFDVGQYELAIREFETGYEYQPLPTFLFDIANVARVAGMNDVASEYYRKYLRSNAPSGAPERAEARRWLAELRTKKGAVNAARPTPAKSADVHRLVGEMETALETPGAPEPPAEPAPVARPAAPAPEAVVAKAPPPEKKPVYKAWWLWTTVGVVVAAGAGVGLYFALSQPYSFPAVSPAPGLGVARF